MTTTTKTQDGINAMLRQDELRAINRQATATFRSSFKTHPDKETDPASALDDARTDACAHIPDGVRGVFDDERLTFVADGTDE
jgi:hypothetical protein